MEDWEEEELFTSRTQDEGITCTLTNENVFVAGLWLSCLAPVEPYLCEMSYGAKATRDLSKKEDPENSSATEEEEEKASESKQAKVQDCLQEVNSLAVFDPGSKYDGVFNLDENAYMLSVFNYTSLIALVWIEG